MPHAISKNTLKFLKELAENNNREWFNENKDLYLEAQENVLQFLEKLIEDISEFDEEILKISAKKALFRIYRDVRFSLDKSPYKNHFGAGLGFGKGGKTSGFYLHIEPGNSFIAGGVYMPEKELLKKIRTNVSENPDEFLKIINDKNFKKTFSDLSQEDKLKRIPQGFEKENPMEDYLKLKSFVVRYSLKDKDLMETSGPEKIAEICKAIKPLNDFIEKSINKNGEKM
ncbi:DUF2461 domain-containing protein [Halpernia frigidisoli]|uniref:TIGR02453 family protein n=1 Tax=Halpernia frigidisoli TaxID=1125876 RepID=A0A1I3F9L8_9FLAO|nr:DUF2461 domain-containing protein [Halpernia frigidisoli]SFI07917.1 TIGR02453 family protein [Halpernia frigidisoli]